MFQGAPSREEMLTNTLSASGTLITVPAGKWYTGNLVLSATVAVAGASNPTVQTAGTNAAPTAGTPLARLNIAGLALSTVSDSVSTEILLLAPDENDITLTFTAGANGVSSASVNGYIFG